MVTHGRLAMRNLTYMIFIQDFHSEAYQFTEKDRLFTAFNDYLDSSVVLPSGNLENKNLISLDEIQNLRTSKQAMKDKAKELAQPTSDDKASLLKVKSIVTNLF